MNTTIFGIENFDTYAVLGILVFFGLIETIAGYLHRTQRSFSDWIQEAGGFLVLSILIKPTIVLTAMGIGNWLFIDAQNSLAQQSLWLTLPLYLFTDDLLQYWYHRSAHEYDFLWKLHRPHHQAEEMGFFVSYRNAGFILCFNAKYLVDRFFCFSRWGKSCSYRIDTEAIGYHRIAQHY